MADFISAKLTGDLAEGLNKFADKISESVLRAGGFAGADLIRKEAVARAPIETGNLKNNIIVKRVTEKSDGGKVQTYIVVIRKGKPGQNNGAYYGNFVEEGHKIVRRKPKGITYRKHRELEQIEFGSRTVAARPFMRPAWESLKGTVLEVMRNQMRKKLQDISGAGNDG